MGKSLAKYAFDLTPVDEGGATGHSATHTHETPANCDQDLQCYYFRHSKYYGIVNNALHSKYHAD